MNRTGMGRAGAGAVLARCAPLLLCCLLLPPAARARADAHTGAVKGARVRSGAERLLSGAASLPGGGCLGMLTNPTAVLPDLSHVVDRMAQANGTRVRARERNGAGERAREGFACVCVCVGGGPHGLWLMAQASSSGGGASPNAKGFRSTFHGPWPLAHGPQPQPRSRPCLAASHNSARLPPPQNISICAVFAPEHGFRGDAQAGHGGPGVSIDTRTGLPVYR